MGVFKSCHNPIVEVRKRNRKIQTLLASVAFALIAALAVLISPEIGTKFAAVASLGAGGGSAILAIVAKHTRT